MTENHTPDPMPGHDATLTDWLAHRGLSANASLRTLIEHERTNARLAGALDHLAKRHRVVDAAIAWRQMRAGTPIKPKPESTALIKAVDDLIQTSATVEPPPPTLLSLIRAYAEAYHDPMRPTKHGLTSTELIGEIERRWEKLRHTGPDRQYWHALEILDGRA